MRSVRTRRGFGRERRKGKDSDRPNILVLEVKKTSNREPRHCDSRRIHALCEQFGYEFAALIECETRPHRVPAVRVMEWLPD
jgi:hypothetical protein